MSRNEFEIIAQPPSLGPATKVGRRGGTGLTHTAKPLAEKYHKEADAVFAGARSLPRMHLKAARGGTLLAPRGQNHREFILASPGWWPVYSAPTAGAMTSSPCFSRSPVLLGCRQAPVEQTCSKAGRNLPGIRAHSPEVLSRSSESNGKTARRRTCQGPPSTQPGRWYLSSCVLLWTSRWRGGGTGSYRPTATNPESEFRNCCAELRKVISPSNFAGRQRPGG